MSFLPISQRARAAQETDVRTCRRCLCTEADCSGCVARTGSPCHWVAHDLCSACVDLVLPREMTPAIAEVLGLPNFRAGPIAHLFRAAGDTIKTQWEDEQAFVLWRFLHLALLHGEEWYRFADADVKAAVDRERCRLMTADIVEAGVAAEELSAAGYLERHATSVGAEMPRLIERVSAKRERWRGRAKSIEGHNLDLGIAMMTRDLDAATAAVGSGDLLGTLRAFEALARYDLDD